jgi:hypothetical protein
MAAPGRKLYGSKEFAYAEPFADALVDDPAFRSWVLRQTKFAVVAEGSRLLCEEMKARRSKSSTNWWRSHYTEKSGETDILAIFEAPDGARFALHFEVKQPADRFPKDKDQAANCVTRADLWVKSAPKAVLPHTAASTVLLCSATKLKEYAPHLPKFGAVITFEQIACVFPKATPVPCTMTTPN